MALRRMYGARPVQLSAAALVGLGTALLGGAGLAFLIPIIEFVRQTGSRSVHGEYLRYFQTVYEVLGIPFTLEFILAGAIVITSVEYLFRGVGGWLLEYISTGYLGDIRTTILDSVLSAHVSYIDERGSDEALNIIITEADKSQRVIRGFIELMQRGGLIGIYFLVAFLVAPRITLVVVALLSTIVFASRQIVRSGYSGGNRIADANQRIQSSAQTAIQGLKDIKIFNYKSTIRGRFRNDIEEYTDARVGVMGNQVLLRNANDYITVVAVFGVIYYGVRFSDLSLGVLGVFAVAIVRLAPSIRRANGLAYMIDSDLPHLVRVQSFVDGLDVYEESTAGQSPSNEIREIRFEDVSFTYESSQVLDGVSFAVERGHHVSFVGGSGAGKSTIVSLLAGFYRPDSGAILIDGHSMGELDIDQWRLRLSIVRQRPFLFDDTIRNNIVLQHQTVDEQRFERACDTAMVEDFVGEMPSGYATEIGENGVKLSGGQRQRVAMARALYADRDVLVLDEATSELDYDMRRDIEEGVAEWQCSRILVVIGHQLSSIRRSDTIYLLGDGEITERGTHDRLRDRSEAYEDLFR